MQKMDELNLDNYGYQNYGELGQGPRQNGIRMFEIDMSNTSLSACLEHNIINRDSDL